MCKFYKPNAKNTGACCSFSVNPKGDKQGIYVEILKQKSWNDEKKTGSFDSTKENKLNLKFNVTEICEIMLICQRQRGAAKFFHTAAVNSQIGFAVWEKDGVAKGISLSVTKGEKKALVPFTFAEAFHLSKWCDFALNKIFAEDFSEVTKKFGAPEMKEQPLD